MPGTAEAEKMARLGLFSSAFAHLLDGKRRITIPAVWRTLVGEPQEVFVMPSLTAECVTVYPMRIMGPRIEMARTLPMTDVEGQMFLRLLGGQSEVLEWDVQGRIRVREDLLEYAGIGNDVTLVGKVDGFELWNPKRLADVKSKQPVTVLRDGARNVGW